MRSLRLCGYSYPLGWMARNGTGLNLAVQLSMRHKHHWVAVKNLLTNMSTIVHGLHCAGQKRPGDMCGRCFGAIQDHYEADPWGVW